MILAYQVPNNWGWVICFGLAVLLPVLVRELLKYGSDL